MLCRVVGYNCEHAVSFSLYSMSDSRSTANVDVVSMIETIVFKGAECTSGNVKRL